MIFLHFLFAEIQMSVFTATSKYKNIFKQQRNTWDLMKSKIYIYIKEKIIINNGANVTHLLCMEFISKLKNQQKSSALVSILKIQFQTYVIFKVRWDAHMRC